MASKSYSLNRSRDWLCNSYVSSDGSGPGARKSHLVIVTLYNFNHFT